MQKKARVDPKEESVVRQDAAPLGRSVEFRDRSTASSEDDDLADLRAAWPEASVFDGTSMFFGGVHSVQRIGDRYVGVGDPRRGGAAITLD